MSAAEEVPRRPVPAPPKQALTQPIRLPSADAEHAQRDRAGKARHRRARRRRRARMPETAIVFVGPMAAGKTSLGKSVAKQLGVPFIDTDAVFVREHGVIADFFAAHGEAEFRRLEESIIAAELARPGTRIVALGGGAVLSAGTRELLRGYPVVLLMTTQAAVLRTANLSRRPLLRDDPEAWGRILEARRPLYEEVADVTFRTDRATKEQLTRRVIEWARSHGRRGRGAQRSGAAKPAAARGQRSANRSASTSAPNEEQPPA